MTNQNSYTDDSAQENTWQIGPRTLPPPAGASDAMRASIAETPQPDPAFMQIEPQSEAEWFAVVEQFDAGKVEAVHALSEQLSVSVEQEQIEGINVYHVTPAEIDPRRVQEERQNFDPAGHYARPDVLRLIVDRRRQTAAEFVDDGESA